MKYTYQQVCQMYDSVIDHEGEGECLDLIAYARDAARVIGTIENALEQNWSYLDIVRAVEWALGLGGEPENTEGL
jgi:hypothetical protein